MFVEAGRNIVFAGNFVEGENFGLVTVEGFEVGLLLEVPDFESSVGGDGAEIEILVTEFYTVYGVLVALIGVHEG